VVWKWRYGKSRPQFSFGEWSGNGDMEKADHEFLLVSGLEMEIWKKQTTVFLRCVVRKWRYRKSRPQVSKRDWWSGFLAKGVAR